MSQATLTAAPVKGTVFTVNSPRARFKDWNGEPREYTVTSVRQGIVHSRTRLGDRMRLALPHYERYALVVSVPDPVEVEGGPTFTATEFRRLVKAAHEAGMAAGQAAVPEPMTVVQYANPLDDSSPIIRRYAPVEGGVCGFAYITVRPGTGSFARHARQAGGWYAAYYGGIQTSVGAFGQSLTRKEAYAASYAAVLREAGVKAYQESRMD